jgi:hypothetical protein
MTEFIVSFFQCLVLLWLYITVNKVYLRFYVKLEKNFSLFQIKTSVFYKKKNKMSPKFYYYFAVSFVISLIYFVKCDENYVDSVIYDGFTYRIIRNHSIAEYNDIGKWC